MTTPEPVVSLPHRAACADLTAHVPPIGFYKGEPFDGSHGEASCHGTPDQCMCGHPDYLTCIDWLADWRKSNECTHREHDACDGRGIDETLDSVVPNGCHCDCHNLSVSQAINARPA